MIVSPRFASVIGFLIIVPPCQIVEIKIEAIKAVNRDMDINCAGFTEEGIIATFTGCFLIMVNENIIIVSTKIMKAK